MIFCLQTTFVVILQPFHPSRAFSGKNKSHGWSISRNFHLKLRAFSCVFRAGVVSLYARYYFEFQNAEPTAYWTTSVTHNPAYRHFHSPIPTTVSHPHTHAFSLLLVLFVFYQGILLFLSTINACVFLVFYE